MSKTSNKNIFGLVRHCLHSVWDGHYLSAFRLALGVPRMRVSPEFLCTCQFTSKPKVIGIKYSVIDTYVGVGSSGQVTNRLDVCLSQTIALLTVCFVPVNNSTYLMWHSNKDPAHGIKLLQPA